MWFRIRVWEELKRPEFSLEISCPPLTLHYNILLKILPRNFLNDQDLEQDLKDVNNIYFSIIAAKYNAE